MDKEYEKSSGDDDNHDGNGNDNDNIAVEKKQMIVYYNPLDSPKSAVVCFLHALARDFMFVCFCRQHHQRRLGTF